MGPSMQDLQGRHVVVTGATGALGAAVVRRLILEGACCHVPVREKDSLDALSDLAGPSLRVERGVDPAREADMERFHGALPALWATVHCVGAFLAGALEATPLAQVERLFESNVFTSWNCARAAARSLQAAGTGGRIVLVAARAGLEPRSGAGMAAYAASKAAVAALTEALGEELAVDGILVNAVAPSVMDTPANRAAMPTADFARWPSTDEVAGTIAWLCSPRHTLVRGAVVPVYGRS
jgi:NAD(P)-dependent dehydrogenase (short-subunit alcohol dehydrogenase family)